MIDMKDKNIFNSHLNWYKANLHSHSTHSDGLLTREEIINIYKKRDYQIISFSEHEFYTDTTKFDTTDFLIYPAIERSVTPLNGEEFHIHGIANYDDSAPVRYQNEEVIPVRKYITLQDIQDVIDELKSHGNFVMINHPNWSNNSDIHLLHLINYDFLEIYNTNCDRELDLGYAENTFDRLVRENHPIKALATDDNHNSNRYDDDIHLWDSFGGFTYIGSEELSREGISNALVNGQFYSSTGPKIFNYGIRNNKIFIECSPCKKISFKSFPRRGYTFYSPHGELYTHFEYDLRGNEDIIRIKIVDDSGHSAWTNPFNIS